MAGYNPAKGEYDPYYNPPIVHRGAVVPAGRHVYIAVPEPGPIGKLVRFIFLSFVLGFLALVALVFVEASGGPTFFDPPLVEILDRASGKPAPVDRGLPGGSIEVDIPATAEEARERFEQEVRRLQASRPDVEVGPPPGFFDEERG